jgi:hypothetical protein
MYALHSSQRSSVTPFEAMPEHRRAIHPAQADTGQILDVQGRSCKRDTGMTGMIWGNLRDTSISWLLASLALIDQPLFFGGSTLILSRNLNGGPNAYLLHREHKKSDNADYDMNVKIPKSSSIVSLTCIFSITGSPSTHPQLT